MWSKRGIVQDALAELGLASFAFQISTDEMTAAVRLMDQMMAMWSRAGIRVGYVLPSGDTGSNPDEDSGLPDIALLAVRKNLAVELAPSFGKPPSPQTLLGASQTYSKLVAATQSIPTMATPAGLPVGAGNRWAYRKYFPQTPDPVTVGPDSTLDF